MRRPERSVIHTLLVHPVISILTPFLALMAVDSVIRAIVPDAISIGFPHYLLVIFTGVVKMLLTKIFKQERLSGAARLLEFIYTSAVLYILASILSWRGFPESFVPGIENIYPLALCSLQWIYSFQLSRLLLSREQFLRLMEQQRVSGLLLIEELKKGGFDDSQAAGDMRRLSLTLYDFFIAGFLGLAATWIFRPPDRLSVFFWMLLLFVDLVIMRILSGEFLRELQLACAGTPARQQPFRKRLLPVFLALAFTGVIALFFSNDSSFIDISGAKIELTENPAQSAAELEVKQFYDQMFVPRPNMQGFKSGLPAEIVQIIIITIAVVAVLSLALFLLSPFFSRGFWGYLRKARPLHVLGQKVRDLGLIIASAFRTFIGLVVRLLSKKRGSANRKISGQASGSTQRLSRQSRRESLAQAIRTDRIIRLFYRIISWAAGRRIYYRFGQSVTDFMTILDENFPEAQVELAFVLDTFDRALFSPHPVGPDAIRRYQDAVKKILRSRKQTR